MKIIEHSKLIKFFLLIIIAVIYLPYMLKGGLIIDDWGVVYNAIGQKFYPTFLSWFPLFSNRPCAPFFIALTGVIFGTCEKAYVLLNTMTWFVAIYIISIIIRKKFGSRVVTFFVSLAVVPVIASTVIFSPAMQFVSTISILLWALSLLFLDKYLDTKNKIYYFMSYLLILISLLTYEITLPLLPINFILPFFHNYAYEKRELIKRFFKYGLSLLIIITIVFLLQKIILPNFITVYSRLQYLDIDEMFNAFKQWGKAVPEAMKLMLKSIAFMDGSLLYRFLGIIIGNILICRALYRNDENQLEHKKYFFALAIAFFLFIGSSVLYMLSGAEVTIGGYGNRGMTATWLLGAFFIAILLDGCCLIDKKLIFISVIVFSLSQLSFMIQADNYIESWKLQKSIINDCVNQFTAVNNEKIEEKVWVVGNVPRYLESNYNNEEVFHNAWDFGMALAIESNGKIQGGNPLTKDKVKSGQVKIEKNTHIIIDSYWKQPINQLWYYEYHENGKRSFLQKIDNIDELKKIIQSIEDKKNFEAN